MGGRQFRLQPRHLVRAHRRVHQLADMREGSGALLGRGGLLGLLERHLQRLVVETGPLGGAPESVLELRSLLGGQPVPERESVWYASR